MPANPADSAMFHTLLGDSEAGALFGDQIVLRAMLLVEGALARVQGQMGMIPAEAAAFIDRASKDVQIDPAALAASTAQNGVPVPAMLQAFRKSVGAPDMMQYLHWGATSQDIMDSAQALRLRKLLAIWARRLDGLLQSLAEMAQTHADLPMAARTYGQIATPTSFGAVVASWGWPLLQLREEIPALETALCKLSLSGAAGTGAAFGPKAAQLRAGVAQELGLIDPGRSWHSDRAGITALAGFSASLSAVLAKMAEDILTATQSGIEEISLASGGGSSTMPQKENPVGPSVMVALARSVQAQSGALIGAASPRGQRDGAAWFTEWLALPAMCIALSRMLALAQDVGGQITPNAAQMARAMAANGGAIFAESVSFALAKTMPRPQSQTIVKDMCDMAKSQGRSLLDIAAQQYPAISWQELAQHSGLGDAPQEARAFAKAVHTADQAARN